MSFAEEQKPDPTKYMELGFRSKIRNTKHYRLQLDHELEKSSYMGDELFTTIKLFRGKKLALPKENFLQRILAWNNETYHESGMFRGNIQVIEDRILQKLTQLKINETDRLKLDLPTSLQDWKQNSVDSELLKSVKVKIRVYIIDA